MHRILPDALDGTRERYVIWYKNCVELNAEKPLWRTAVAFDDGIPCGYFTFGPGADPSILMWGEMEIDDRHKGDRQTFRALVDNLYLEQVERALYERHFDNFYLI
jgi:hypothetical protein